MKKYLNGQYIEMTEEEITEFENIPVDNEYRIQELKQNLADSDYVACKLAEGVATKEEYSDILEQREQWRKEINILESEGL